MRIEYWASMTKEYGRRRKLWKSARGLVVQWSRQRVWITLLICSLTVVDSTTQKKPNLKRSIYSRRRAKSIWSLGVTGFLGIYTGVGECARKPSTITKYPSR